MKGNRVPTIKKGGDFLEDINNPDELLKNINQNLEEEKKEKEKELKEKELKEKELKEKETTKSNKKNCHVTKRENNSYDVECTTGGSNKKLAYTKYLNKKTVKELHELVNNKNKKNGVNINIKTKKNGKTSYLNKAGIVKKLCDFKHPK